MMIVLALLLPVVIFFVGRRASPVEILHSMVTGVLVHSIYLGGVFFAISHGMSAGVSALVVALQPLLTVFIARAMIGERVSMRQIAGLLAALTGVALVLSPRIAGGTAISGVTPLTLLSVAASVIGISTGAVYQKRFSTGMDIRLNTFWQYAGSLVPLGALSLLVETREIHWSGEFLFALAWLIFVLSIGAVSLLMFLIRRESAASTAALFYLVPVSTAIIAWLLFDETLQPVQFVGMAIVIAALVYGRKRA